MRRLPALAAALALVVAGVQAQAQIALDEHGGPVKGVALSADGERALTAGFDYSIILWDLPQGAALAHLYGHEAAVNAVAFLPGERAASASDDGTLALWDLARGELLARLAGHEGKIAALAVSPDGRLAATAGWDRTARVWDLERQVELMALPAPDNLNAIRFSPDGERLLTGASDGSLEVFRVADGIRLAALRAHDFGVTGLALDGEGMLAATASVDETVQLWDLEAGEPTLTLYGHEGPVLAVDLSADGELVASGGVDGTVRVWRRGDGDRLRVYERHQGAVWSVAFAPDGATLISGGADGLVVTYALDGDAEAGGTPAAERRATSQLEVVDDGSRGAELFRACVGCHTVEPDGGHRAGPTLHGLFGRRAGGHPGYPYSDALRGSELVWTEETVSRLFEVGPDELVPGSKMPLQRMPNPDDRAELIDYLRRITDD